MAGNPMLRQWSNERASWTARVFPGAGAGALGRRRVVSGIRWRGDLMVTAAEAVADAERLEVHLESGAASAEVLATDLATDVAVLRIAQAGPLPAQAPAPILRVGEAIAIIGRDPLGRVALWGSVRIAGPGGRSRRGRRHAQPPR